MINKILVAVDRSPSSKSVFDAAFSLAQTTGANLMLLHVLLPKERDYPILPVATFDTYYSLVEEIDEDRYYQKLAEYEQKGLELLQNLAEKATKNGINTKYTQLSGNPGRIICELANNWSADLIVVGSRGLKGLKEMFLGSVSNYVTHHAPCSILIVRHPIDSELEQSPGDEIDKSELLTPD